MDENKQSTNGEIVDDLDSLKFAINDKFDEIANCFNDEELNKDYAQKDGHINWTKVRKICRKELSVRLKTDWNEMLEMENVSQKLITLKNIVKNAPVTSKKAWRPKTGDIGQQARSLDAMQLEMEKDQLKAILKRKEARVAELKSTLSTRWDDFRLLDKRLEHHWVVVDEQANEIHNQLEQIYHKDEKISKIDPQNDVSFEKFNNHFDVDCK